MANSRICSIADCGKPALKRGMCNAHYLRWWKYGDPLIRRKPANDEAIEFLLQTVLTYEGDECLIWPFSRADDGYGIITINRRRQKVHRFVCEAANGPSPAGRPEAAHSCGKGHLACCTKGHLRWASHGENMMDRVDHGTHNRGGRHPENKLSEADVRAIRSMIGEVTQRDLAKQFGVSPGHISQIQTRKLWAWLE